MRRKNKRFLPILCGVGFSLGLSGCSGSAASYQDGSYLAMSSVYENEDGSDEGNGYGEVSLTISGGRITGCSFQTYQPDGVLKDADYGKQDGEIANQDYYNKAQRAVQASQNYAEQLAAKGDLKQVDAISGATISYDEFKEAVRLALKQAKQ